MNDLTWFFLTSFSASRFPESWDSIHLYRLLPQTTSLSCHCVKITPLWLSFHHSNLSLVTQRLLLNYNTPRHSSNSFGSAICIESSQAPGKDRYTTVSDTSQPLRATLSHPLRLYDVPLLRDGCEALTSKINYASAAILHVVMSDTAGTRYTTLTSTNQSANIWVVSIIAICVSTACFAIRGLSKSRTGLKFGADDYTLIGGWVRSLKYTILVQLY
jgi:hypothetical protein